MRRTRIIEKNTPQKGVSKSGREPEAVCTLCGSELEVEPESGEAHCPVCEDQDNG